MTSASEGVSCGITSGDGDAWTSREIDQSYRSIFGACDSTHYLLLRRGVVPHETTGDIDVECSGFAALRLRQHPMSSTPERGRGKSRARVLKHDTSQPPRIHSEGSWPERGRGKSRARVL